MRIGVISDTHGNIASIERCVEKANTVTAWLHLGDFCDDAGYLRRLTGRPVYSVKGNCDYGSYPLEQVVRLDGVNILLCHGHSYSVNYSTHLLANRAEELCCHAALYGHTHIPELSAYGKILLLNPGSPAKPRIMPTGILAKRTFAILEIENNQVNADIIALV